MPWRNAPDIDFDEQPQYRWPSWRVGHELEDLFGELHEQFNTVPIFIQDPDAFHHDVAELAGDAPSKEVFLAKLEERKSQRLEELRNFEENLTALMITGFNRLLDPQMKAFVQLCNSASFDSLIAFWATFLGPNKYGTEPSLDLFDVSSSRRFGMAASLDYPRIVPVTTLPPDITHVVKRGDKPLERVSTFPKGKRKRTDLGDEEGTGCKKKRHGEGLLAQKTNVSQILSLQNTEKSRQGKINASKSSKRNTQGLLAGNNDSVTSRSRASSRKRSLTQDRKAVSQLRRDTSDEMNGTNATRSSRRLAAKLPEFGDLP